MEASKSNLLLIESFDQMAGTVILWRGCDYHEIVFEAPFKGMTKGEIIKEGLNMDLDYSKAWTCYEGKENPCGKCSACLERQNAFKINNIEDPL